MKTRNERGEVLAPTRLLEMLEFRFGAFEAIAYAASELAERAPDSAPPMDAPTARAILEFADDLKQAYRAAVEWSEGRGSGIAVQPKHDPGSVDDL